jgi:hypothetical protein
MHTRNISYLEKLYKRSALFFYFFFQRLLIACTWSMCSLQGVTRNVDKSNIHAADTTRANRMLAFSTAACMHAIWIDGVTGSSHARCDVTDQVLVKGDPRRTPVFSKKTTLSQSFSREAQSRWRRCCFRHGTWPATGAWLGTSAGVRPPHAGAAGPGTHDCHGAGASGHRRRGRAHGATDSIF